MLAAWRDHVKAVAKAEGMSYGKETMQMAKKGKYGKEWMQIKASLQRNKRGGAEGDEGDNMNGNMDENMNENMNGESMDENMNNMNENSEEEVPMAEELAPGDEDSIVNAGEAQVAGGRRKSRKQRRNKGRKSRKSRKQRRSRKH